MRPNIQTKITPRRGPYLGLQQGGFGGQFQQMRVTPHIADKIKPNFQIPARIKRLR